MCLNGIKFILIISSPIGIYQNSDRFKVKFASLGDWYDVRTVNIAKFRPECHSWTSILDTCTLKLASDSLYVLSTEIMIT